MAILPMTPAWAALSQRSHMHSPTSVDTLQTVLTAALRQVLPRSAGIALWSDSPWPSAIHTSTECSKLTHKPDTCKTPKGQTTWGRPTMANWTLRSWPRGKGHGAGQAPVQLHLQAFSDLPLLHGLLAEVPQRALLVYLGSQEPLEHTDGWLSAMAYVAASVTLQLGAAQPVWSAISMQRCQAKS